MNKMFGIVKTASVIVVGGMVAGPVGAIAIGSFMAGVHVGAEGTMKTMEGVFEEQVKNWVEIDLTEKEEV